MTKTIRVSGISVPLRHDREQVFRKACRTAGIRGRDVRRSQIVRQSVDARHKEDVKYIYSVDLTIEQHTAYNRRDGRVREVSPMVYAPKACGSIPISAPPAVIGAGPAGLFCAYLLARHGYRPLVFERGKRVDERQADVERFWNGGTLLPDSNVQFGEGGAGTFSDGKLNTLVRDKCGRNRFVLETFVSCGAPGDILYAGRPHIGTDVLRTVVANMRDEILRMGGQFCFSSKITDLVIKNHRLHALEINREQIVPVSAAVLAIGHSARDTFEMLRKHNILMEPKAFAVGMRVEHPQDEINRIQYGSRADLSLLPAASYKLTHRAANGRSVYSFCMCPGGYVVNASSEPGHLTVNGMSDRARDSRNANSAIIVSVTPEDFPDPDDPLSGAAFQRDLEEKAWRAGRGKIPQQRFGDFEHGCAMCGAHLLSCTDSETDTHLLSCTGSETGTRVSSCTKGLTAQANLRDIFPDAVSDAFIDGMHAFSGKIPGFDREDTILSAVESRTSSPVRILRGEDFQSSVRGLYPCGEGAGYAGGITSAAMDGLKTAEAIMAVYKEDNP
ncbi:MAG: NAD(P)-binding protein [Lachnospiraceae bacterium]|nr:NAD(P)-binding protein [Lachnospiraceae bacterium]